MKEIKIPDDAYIDWLEFYEACYSCQECNGILFREFNYCPYCGNKLLWVYE